MADLFLYGTLRHRPLLELVLGRGSTDWDAEFARLPGHAVLAVKDQPFPAIVRQSSAEAVGLLVRGLLEADLAALDFYEGGFDYLAVTVEVQLQSGGTAEAGIYFPQPGAWETAGPWDLEAWVRDWGALTLRAAEEVMAYRGRMSAAEVARRFPSVRRRAAAWLDRQAQDQDPDHPLDRDVIVHSHQRSHMNFFAMEDMELQFRRYDGSMSPVVSRSAAMVGQAAVVLPYDPRRDEVLLVEQFRAATFMAGEQRPWMWEPVAGLVDPGEAPQQTAVREAMEEAGVQITRLDPVAQVYASSGASGEFIHIFVGLADLSETGGGGGVDSEAEDIRSQVLSYTALMENIDAQAYQDMPLVTAALWLSRHRERLRRAGA
ncbi:NUDIX domain-containing protein [Roseobacteraceae bacterium NS-SX3]